MMVYLSLMSSTSGMERLKNTLVETHNIRVIWVLAECDSRSLKGIKVNL